MNRYVAALVLAAVVPLGALVSLGCVVGVAAIERYVIGPRRPRRPWNVA